eukprot:5773153-Karenia_brevis.AAC.1
MSSIDPPWSGWQSEAAREKCPLNSSSENPLLNPKKCHCLTSAAAHSCCFLLRAKLKNDLKE